MLNVENLNVYYGNIHAIKDVSLKVNKKEVVSLIGANGAGDSDIMMTDTINPLKSKFKASTKLLNKTI